MSGRFTVVWRRRVIEREIAEFAVQAMERGEDLAAINEAMNTIDGLLEVAPETRGESRNEYQRVLIVGPLTVLFEVVEDQEVVVIMSAHYHPGNRSEP